MINTKYRLLNEKNKIIVETVSNMNVKDKRKIFSILRQVQPNESQMLNYIFPAFGGITLGEFCTSHVLHNDTNRRKKN